MEQWAIVPIAPRYAVSTERRIWSWAPNKWGTQAGRYLKPTLNHRLGYLYVTLSVDGLKRKYYMQELVLYAFAGLRPSPKHQAAHLNGVRHDNRWANLEWVTKSENEMHRLWHGTSNAGEQNGQAVLTADEVRTLMADYANLPRRHNGMVCNGMVRDLVSRYGISVGALYSIKNGYNWKWLGGMS